MKILLLAPHPFFAQRGTPIAVRALAETLGRKGHQITLLTYHEGSDVEIPNGKLLRISAPRALGNVRPGFSFKKLVLDILLLFACLRCVGGERFDLIHAVEEGAFIAMFAGWLYRVPFVYDMDSSLVQQMIERYPILRRIERVMNLFERSAVCSSVGVLAVCKSLAEVAHGYDPNQLVARLEDVTLLTPPAADGEELAKTIDAEGPIVMYVGNLAKYQGIDLLLEGFCHAAHEMPEAQLVVIGGDAQDIEHYRARTRDLGISGQAHFLGPRPLEELAHYLNQAVLLVSPRTQGENTAMKVYSYMDSGRALLATDLVTHTQVLDTSTALLAPPEPKAWGEALLRLLRDEALRDRLALAARQRVAEEFSPQAFDRKLLEFYAQVESRIP